MVWHTVNMVNIGIDHGRSIARSLNAKLIFFKDPPSGSIHLDAQSMEEELTIVGWSSTSRRCSRSHIFNDTVERT